MINKNLEDRVLALKYRPKRFEDLIGQSTVSQTLSLALDSKRLSHAYLFSGLRGSGKTSTARIMAKALLCSNGPTSKPCETCENCLSANSGKHLDIIEMDAASNRGIDDIKDLIEHTKYKPSSAKYKVFIIDEVHMLTTQAFNALLKTLEEPPNFVKFILATTDALKLPATILSRTQHFRFNKISQNDVVHHLSYILNKEEIDFEKPALEILARSGQGSLRDTLTLLDQAIIFSKGRVTTASVVEMLGLIEPQKMDTIFNTILNGEDIKNILKDLDIYETSQVIDEMTLYLKDKMLSKDSRFDMLLYDRFFRILSDAKHLLAINSDGGFVLILTMMKLSEATKLRSIDEIINQVEKIETKEVERAVKSVEVKAVESKPIEVQVHKANIETPKEVEVPEKIVEEVVERVVEPIIEEPIVEVQETLKDEEIVEIKEEKTQVTEKPLEFITPFDEVVFVEKYEEPTKIVQNIEEPVNEENRVVQEVEEVQQSQIVQAEQKQEEIKQQEPQEETSNETYSNYDPSMEVELVPLEDESDEYEDLYNKVIEKVFDRDVDLGECFERNFIYNGYINNKLEIISYAKDDDRKFLYQHFGIIKSFIYDVFGQDVELDFKKEEATILENSEPKSSQIEIKEEVEEKNSFEDNVQETEDCINETGSMIEEIEMGGSGCVASMTNVANPTLAQKELNIEDILNSKMLNKAKELFDIKKITVKSKS